MFVLDYSLRRRALGRGLFVPSAQSGAVQSVGRGLLRLRRQGICACKGRLFAEKLYFLQNFYILSLQKIAIALEAKSAVPRPAQASMLSFISPGAQYICPRPDKILKSHL